MTNDFAPKYRLLFVCLTAEEADALAPVARALESDLEGAFRCDFAAQDELYCHELHAELVDRGLNVRNLSFPVHLDTHYSDAGVVDQIRALLSLHRTLPADLDEYDALVVGTETLPAGVLLNAANSRDMPTFQVIPSLVTDTPLYPESESRRRVKKSIKSNIVSKLPYMDFLAERNEATRGQADHVFTLGERITETLVDMGFSGPTYHSTGIPRFNYLFKHRDIRQETQRNNRVILYLPGAFHRHIGVRKLHEYQQSQIQTLANRVSDRDGYELHIKLHPREEESFYGWTETNSSVRLFPADTEPLEVAANATVVTTIGSTLGYECAVSGIPVTLSRFPDDPSPDSMMASHFRVMSDANELFDFTEQLYSDNQFREAYARTCQESAYKVIDPATPDSAERIAETIAGELIGEEAAK